MPFIWRTKSDTNNDVTVNTAALSCLEAGYILFSIEEGKEEFSENLHVILSANAEIRKWPQLIAALSSDGEASITQVCNALRDGHVTSTVTISNKEGNKHFLCKPAIAPTEEGMPRMAVLWVYDISSEFRQQQQVIAENEKLKTEVKNFSTMINMFPFPIWQRDKSLAIRYYNLAYGEIVEEMPGSGSGDEVPELDRRAQDMAERAQKSEDIIDEQRHVIAEGERKLFHLYEVPIPGEDRQLGFAHDISEMENIKQELQLHRSAQSDLLESSASAMAIYSSDMRLTHFNVAFQKLWELDEAWLEMKPTYGEILERLREHRALPEQANFRAFKQEQMKLFVDTLEPHEDFFHLPDGRAIRVIVIPHALGGLLFAYEDVTDRLALERSYNTLIAVQRETLDHLSEGVAVFGEDGRLRLSNPVYHKMWHIDEAIAKTEPHIADLVDRSKHLYIYDDWDSFREKRVAQTQSRKFDRQRLEQRDGNVIDCTTVPLPDGATLNTYIDMTASILVERSLREKNEALQAADRLKSEFLANVSYELRSPLTSISGFSEMLRQEYLGELTDKQKEYVSAIHKSSQHLMQLINDILDLTSIEAGYLQLDIAKCDIANLLQSVLSLIQERAKENDISVEFECQKDIGALWADETRVRQVLFNLLSNAIKFSPSGSNIKLGAYSAPEDTIILWVQDNGYGIPIEQQDKIFNTFFKAENPDVPKTRSKRGTGLGLSVVKNFIELHGGTVTLQSAPGKGTKISCILPRKNEELV